MTSDSSSPAVSELVLSSAVLAIDGLAVAQPAEAVAEVYQPQWYKAWEGKLYQDARRKLGRDRWAMTRFGTDPGRGGYRDTLQTLATTCREALLQAGVRGGARPRSDRMALLHFDHWGQVSHLENAFSWRDAFNLDVIPKFLLREHGISGFSCRIRGERAALMDALTVASELLGSGQIDIAVIGGVFRFHPALGFSAALSDAAAEQQWTGSKGKQYEADVIERVGFVVVRRPEDSRKGGAGLLLAEPTYLALPDGKQASVKALAGAWAQSAGGQPWAAYSGMSPSETLAEIEAQAAEQAGVAFHELCRTSGDSGCITPFLGLQQFSRHAAASSCPSELCLLTVTDSSGGAWILKAAFNGTERGASSGRP